MKVVPKAFKLEEDVFSRYRETERVYYCTNKGGTANYCFVPIEDEAVFLLEKIIRYLFHELKGVINSKKIIICALVKNDW